MSEKSLTMILPLPEPLLTINARRRMHWSMQRLETRNQREMAAWVARAQTLHCACDDPYFPEGRVRVDVEVEPHPGQKQPDDSAVWEAMKPLWDGLEDANIVMDDKQFVVGALVWNKRRRTGTLTLTLTAAPR